jgi:PAS domain S-box-containing protein
MNYGCPNSTSPLRLKIFRFSALYFYVLIFSIFATFLICPVRAQVSDAARKKSVLVLYDERDKLPGLAVLDQSLRSTVSSAAAFEIDVYSESLDRSRFQDEGYNQVLSDFLRRKYSRKKIDVIVAAMGPSLDFLLAHAEEIFPGIPIVFCGVDQREIESRNLKSNVTGVLVKRRFKETLDAALRLQPNTRQVVFIAGTSDFDKRLLEQAMGELRPYEDRLAFRYLTNLALDELLKEVSQLPPHTIILFSTVFRDGAGQSFITHNVVSLVSKQANVPVYGFLDQYMGRGIVGGHLYSVEAHGKKAGELALRILEGQKAADIPIAEEDASFDMFDWRQLQRWGISEEDLPPSSNLRFKELSAWEQYKWHIAGAVALSIFQTFLIAWLLLAQKRRRAAEKQRNAFQQLAVAEHRRLDEVVANTPGVVWEALVDQRTGVRRINFVSDYIEKMLDYSVEEWLSTPNMGTSLVAEEDRDLVNRAMNAVVNQGQGQTVEYRWLAKDGKPRWVEAKVVPIQDETGKTIGLRGFTMDISERKKAEEVVHDLSRRLMNAQEKERARLARELHDDLSQSIALMSIQLSVLRNEPKDLDYVKDQLDQFASDVGRLSGDVHRISHELHPAKLSQLGLESSLRGLCRSLSVAHPLKIDFEAENLPRHLPEDISLCLYRIVQESLQNVIKHSRATSTQVNIKLENGNIHLSVSDNGKGFNPTAKKSKEALGLISIDERARAVKGESKIISAVGTGTKIEILIPVNHQAREF